VIAREIQPSIAGRRYGAQKVENRDRELRFDRRGLLEGDLPGAVAAEAEAGAAVMVGKSFAVEGAGALQAVEDDGGVIAENFDLKLGPSGVMEFVAGREDDSQDGGATEDLAVGRHVNVFGSHEAVHGGAVVFEPCGVPGFGEVFDLLLHYRGFHRSSRLYEQRSTSDDYKSEFERTQQKFAGLKAAATKASQLPHPLPRNAKDGAAEKSTSNKKQDAGLKLRHGGQPGATKNEEQIPQDNSQNARISE